MTCSELLPVASRVGKTIVGGIDLNKARMRRVADAVIALSPSPNGFTASDVAARMCALCNDRHPSYGPRHAAYDFKKLRGKHIVCRISHTCRYQPLASGLRAIAALVILRNNAIKPRRRPAPSPNSRPAKPQSDRHPLRCPFALPWAASSMNSGSPLDHRQNFCRGFARSANKLFCILHEEYKMFPEYEQLPGAIKTSFPFEIAQKLLYNACIEMTITASPNK